MENILNRLVSTLSVFPASKFSLVMYVPMYAVPVRPPIFRLIYIALLNTFTEQFVEGRWRY